MNKETGIVIVMLILMMVAGVVLGRATVTLEECPICITTVVQKEVIKKEIRIKQLKNEINNIHIIGKSRSVRDSLRAIYNPR